MSKRIVFTILALLLLLSVTSCGRPSNNAENDDDGNEDFTARCDDQLAKAHTHLSNHYLGFYFVANALDEEDFEDSELKLVFPGTEPATFESLRDAAARSGGTQADMCVGAVGFYDEIMSFDTETADQHTYIDFCQRLYEYLQSLSEYLDVPMSDIVFAIDDNGVPIDTDTQTNGGDADSGNIADSRWDGDTASGAMNGYSIVFQNGRAYFGTTYETDSTIIDSGLELTYTISGNQITFSSVSDSRSVVMTYGGSTITDNEDPQKCAFKAGYVFSKQ